MKKENGNLKLITGLVVGMLIGGVTVVGANQAIQALQNTEIKVSLNGQIQEFKDETTGETQYPITYHDRTYLPLRNIAQLVGLNVDYNNSTSTAMLSSKDHYTDDELLMNATAYQKITTNYASSFIEVDITNGDMVTIHLYDLVDGHIATSDWYTINKYSGKGYDLLNNEIDISDKNIIKLMTQPSPQKSNIEYINMDGLNKNRLYELFDISKFEYDKEYKIAYTTLGTSPISYDVFYKKILSNNNTIEYIILNGSSNRLEICIYAQDYLDYAEKIFTLHEGDVLGIATYNEKGDTNQSITLYDYKLDSIKNSSGRVNEFHYDDWVSEFGYEHQYGFDIINDNLYIYRNVENKKVTYQIVFEKGDGTLYDYVYSILEISRTGDGFKMGAGRT